MLCCCAPVRGSQTTRKRLSQNIPGKNEAPGQARTRSLLGERPAEDQDRVVTVPLVVLSVAGHPCIATVFQLVVYLSEVVVLLVRSRS